MANSTNSNKNGNAVTSKSKKVSQTDNGMAFEYACLWNLYCQLHPRYPAKIDNDNGRISKTKDKYQNVISSNQRQLMDAAAIAAAQSILSVEPMLTTATNDDPIVFHLQDDSAGQKGDVRDLVITRHNWEIGFSCKWNNDDAKHSRCGIKTDFGKSWFDCSCTPYYRNAVMDSENGLFGHLEKLQKNLKERGEVWYWKDFGGYNLKEDCYALFLLEFSRELKRLDSMYPNEIPKRMASYILGRHDFYKIVAWPNKREVIVEGFNLNGDLNHNGSNGLKPVTSVKQLLLPSSFHSIDFMDESRNNIFVVCDHGWQFRFRIHNAEANIKPVLKFAISIDGMPPSIYKTVLPW